MTGDLYFLDPADRARLSPAAIGAIRMIAGFWGLDDAEAADLFGLSPEAWRSISSRGWEGALSADQMTRASVLIGVFRALNCIFADDMAHRWIRLPNSGPLFGGVSPMDVMRERGIAGMIAVRERLVDLGGWG